MNAFEIGLKRKRHRSVNGGVWVFPEYGQKQCWGVSPIEELYRTEVHGSNQVSHCDS